MPHEHDPCTAGSTRRQPSPGGRTSRRRRRAGLVARPGPRGRRAFAGAFGGCALDSHDCFAPTYETPLLLRSLQGLGFGGEWAVGAILVAEYAEVRGYGRDDLVSFLIGCSFTFGWALTGAGVPIRHVEQGRDVPMYVTNRRCRPAGRLRGPLVVSTRPVPPEHLATAIRESSPLPAVHGGPVHCGDPSGLGIGDLGSPDFGEPVDAGPDDIPVFRACGVTPQAAVAVSRPPFALAHAPGQMFLTDARDEQCRVA
ncbi:D-glutamate cyclase family protein [Streptomyces sp. NPDC003522]